MATTKLCLLMMVILTFTAVTAAPPCRLCYVVRPSNGPTTAFMFSKFTVEYYRQSLSNLDWIMVPITNGNANPTSRDAVQAMVKNGDGCDALLGPGSSSYSVALSSIANIPWVDFSSSSTELSDKSAYPWFNRVIATDAQIAGGMADLILGMGWRSINLVASNDAYGSSIAQQLTASFVPAGGAIAISQTIAASTTLLEAHTLLNLIEAGSRSRIIAFATAANNPLFINFINATVTRGLQRKYVFVFSESACSGDTTWLALQGALCVTFRVNSTLSSVVTAAYSQRNVTDDLTIIANYGRTAVVPPSLYYSMPTFNAFAHDATRALMMSLNAAAASASWSNSSVANRRAAALAAIRNVSFAGLSGPVSFNSKGDRNSAELLILNVDSTGRTGYAVRLPPSR